MSDVENQQVGVSAQSPTSDKKQSKGKNGQRRPSSMAKARKGKGGTRTVVFCVCQGKDDGRPMIRCDGHCRNWYHFECVSLSEDDAGDVVVYVCPDCEAKTGLRTVMEWEGPDALEKVVHVDDIHDNPAKSMTSPKKKSTASSPIKKEEEPKEPEGPKDKEHKELKYESAEESADDGSEDDYVEEPANKRLKSAAGRSRTRRVSVTSESSGAESTAHEGKATARSQKVADRRPAKRKLPSGTPETASKRKDSLSLLPSSKKTKLSDDRSSQDDPVRKYCLGKLEEVIRPIFLEHSVLEDRNTASTSTSTEQVAVVHLPKELSEEEKMQLEHEASAYVSELEECIFKTYSEHDKTGHPSAAGKYKERFRMLTFNLAKADRIALRKGIASRIISPYQLSSMSSTDLANEQTQHDIQLAEKESLEHSILKKMTAPRAKITHKGLESIEDVNGVMQRDSREEAEEQMERERRERERLARLKSALQTQNLQAEAGPPSAVGFMPHSPTNTQGRSGSGAGQSSFQAMQQHPDQLPLPSPVSARPPVRPLFVPSTSDMLSSIDDGLNLTDLINIDEDSPPRDVPIAQPSPPHVESTPLLSESVPTAAPSPELSTPSGPSPFAPSQPLSSPKRGTFDLNALWTEQTGNAPPEEEAEQPEYVDHAEDMENTMDVDDLGEEAEDRDFDLLLNQDDQLKEADFIFEVVPEPVRKETLADLPSIWSGTVSMPLDASAFLTPLVTAAQIGGRNIEPGSPLWKVLFPSMETRIDGRVPIDRSSQYLLTNRLNVAKELIAVCFIPSGEQEATKLQDLIKFLVDKNRHGLVFPWGHHPPPHAPGKELYLAPLLRDAPTPEYIEMLDDLRFPKERTSDVLLGVFVLNKDKFQVVPAPHPAPVPYPSVPAPFHFPTLPTSSGHSHLPNISSVTPVPHVPNINPTALAAEVASLTPTQITSLLQQLSQSSSLAAPVPPPPAFPPNILVPPLLQFSIAQPPPPPAFSPYPPILPQQQPPASEAFGFRSPYDTYDRERGDHRRQSSFDSEERRGSRAGRSRGDRGRGQSRGGRGRGDRERDGDRRRSRQFEDRARDSGWGGRGRGTSQRSPDGGRLARF